MTRNEQKIAQQVSIQMRSRLDAVAMAQMSTTGTDQSTEFGSIADLVQELRNAPVLPTHIKASEATVNLLKLFSKENTPNEYVAPSVSGNIGGIHIIIDDDLPFGKALFGVTRDGEFFEIETDN